MPAVWSFRYGHQNSFFHEEFRIEEVTGADIHPVIRFAPFVAGPADPEFQRVPIPQGFFEVTLEALPRSIRRIAFLRFIVPALEQFEIRKSAAAMLVRA